MWPASVLLLGVTGGVGILAKVSISGYGEQGLDKLLFLGCGDSYYQPLFTVGEQLHRTLSKAQ